MMVFERRSSDSKVPSPLPVQVFFLMIVNGVRYGVILPVALLWTPVSSVLGHICIVTTTGLLLTVRL